MLINKIPASGQAEMRKPIIIKEGDNLRLRCSASGYPEPKSKNLLSIFNRI